MKRKSGPAAVLAACLCLAGCRSTAVVVAPSTPPGAPSEDVRFAGEWPAPNGDLHNTRVAHSTISSSNVTQLGVAWTLPLDGVGTNGADVANPVMANGVAYLQDGRSNVTAVRYETGQVLWTHPFDSSAYGPNGVTLANGRVFGVTANGIFALDAQTGQQVWNVTDFGPPKAEFNLPPQVSGGKVFVSSSITAGGGIIYALNADTGATLWSFQTVIDKVGQQLQATAGGAWDAVLIGPDQSIYAGIGNPYLSLQQAQQMPSQELYTDSLVKLDQATGKLQWYYQAFPNDFHDWDLQVSPIYTTAAGHPAVLAAGKGGFVFAFDPASGRLLWKTAVGVHNGHDDDDQLALDGKLQLDAPYTLEPGEIGGVETNMAAADGVAYVPVVDVPTTYASATAPVGTPDLTKAASEVVALDIATGKQLWDQKSPGSMPLGAATISNDLVFTTTLNGVVAALSRKDGAIIWTAQLPAGSNAPLAISGDTLIAGAGLASKTSGHAAVVAYRLGAKSSVSPQASG
jgi:outer membrane protein assembly factor BamB